MTEQSVRIQNKIGLHARPASMLVKTAGKYKSDVTIINGERSASIKSMISLLTLHVKMNDVVTIQANGEDEKEVVDALVELINSGFGEE